MWNKKNLAIGILFAILAVVCLTALMAHNVTSYYVTGLVLCTVIAVAFFRRARK